MPGTEAVLIVRAWFERGHEPMFRARVLGVRLNDPAASEMASTPDKVVQIVCAWLEEVQRTELEATEKPAD